MATDLDGIFNVGLNGLRDRKVFDNWLVELKKLNLGHAKNTNSEGKTEEEEGDWYYETTGFGGDDPDDNDIDSPFELNFYGPFMFSVHLMDDISKIPTFYRLHTLFEQPYFFEEFIDEVHEVLRLFNATEVTWLSSLGNASAYSSIYQSEVWENVPYKNVMETLIKRFGNPISYEEAKQYDENVNWSYSNLDCFVSDTFCGK